MSEQLQISQDYKLILSQIKSICEDEKDIIANLANITALLMTSFEHHWIGFYFVKGDQLVLGPFQGLLACTRINYNKGVCGKSWADKSTIIVPNVHEFPGHIACSALSNSEIVIPIIKAGEVIMILDIDSIHFNQFTLDDKIGLESIAVYISSLL